MSALTAPNSPSPSSSASSPASSGSNASCSLRHQREQLQRLQNPLAGPDHSDRPQMEWEWIFGKKATPNGAKMHKAPNVIIVA